MFFDRLPFILFLDAVWWPYLLCSCAGESGQTLCLYAVFVHPALSFSCLRTTIEGDTALINTVTQTAQHNWWLLLLRGVFAIIFGIIALVFPGIALLALIYIFAAYAFLDGILAVIVAISERRSLPRWGWLLVEGLAGIVIGILAFAWPGETALVLLYIVAAWAILTGVMEIAAAFTIRSWLFGLAGVLSIVFGIILFVHPGAGLLSILWLLGIYAIVFGVILIVHAFQLRSGISSTLDRMGKLHT